MPACAREAECASRKKSPTLTGAVFVLTPQALELLQENVLVYGGCMSWGIYTQADPIGLRGGLNRFSYVEGNPLSFSDPMGLQRGPMNRPSTREINRSGGAIPSAPPSIATNSNWRQLFNDLGNNPTFPETNLPGAWPGINYIPPITKPIVLPPSGANNNGCTIFLDPPNQCGAGPQIVCGPTIGPIR